MQIPFVDLRAQYLDIKEEIDGALSEVIRKTAFIGGEYVNGFEKNFAERYGLKHCISVGNGTDSLYIILKMLGIGQGDEVITVANSWISSSETITQAGAKPVFIDIHPEYYSMDENLLEAKISPRTKAVIAVHLQGQMCAIEQIKKICDKHGISLIEDCAQSHFSEFDGRYAGTFGQVCSFSFYPGKNLGAYGDAGAILTNSDELATKCKMFARHGALKKHNHQVEGINSRMDGLQAAILNVKLQYIQSWNERRIEHAKTYDSCLSGISEIVIPRVRPGSKHTFHLYVIRAQKRNELQAYLAEKGIETAIHYPTILPLLPAYSYLKHTAADFPVAARYQNEILSLPMYPELKEGMIKNVAAAIKDFYAS